MTEKQVVKYDVTKAAISKMHNLYMDLTVADIEDEKGFAEVEAARKVVKGKRVSTEKQRKVFKKDALEYGRKVDAEAKGIFALLEPIESHLIKQGDIVRDEEKRVEAEKEAAEKKKVQDRVNAFLMVDVVMDFFDAVSLDDDEFAKVLDDATIAYNAEQERLATEEKAKIEQEIAEREERERQAATNKAESERLEKVRLEQEEIAAGIRLQQEQLKAEQKKLDDAKQAEQDAKDRIALEKRLAEEAEARAQKEAQDAADRAAQEKIEAEAEAERQEVLKPDKERLIAHLNSLLEIEPPVMSDDGTKAILSDFDEALNDLIVDAKHDLAEV